MSKDPLNIRNERVREAFDMRRVSDFSEDELHEFTDTLCDDGLRSAEGQSRAMLRILAINHVQMRRHISDLNAANGKTQRWFIAFAVMSLIGLGVQIYRDFTAESVVAVGTSQSQPGVPHNAKNQAAPSNVKSGGTVTQPPPKP